MSGGLTWSCEEQEKETIKIVSDKFSKLNTSQMRYILESVRELKKEPMTRYGHGLVDFILEALGEDL